MGECCGVRKITWGEEKAFWIGLGGKGVGEERISARRNGKYVAGVAREAKRPRISLQKLCGAPRG